MDYVKITIAGKEYKLKFTIGFWKRIKISCDVDAKNIESRLQEDFGNVATKIVLESIVGDDKPTVQEIEDSLDRSVMDIFEQAIINGMTSAEKELVELAKKQRYAAIQKIEGKILEGAAEGKA